MAVFVSTLTWKQEHFSYGFNGMDNTERSQTVVMWWKICSWVNQQIFNNKHKTNGINIIS